MVLPSHLLQSLATRTELVTHSPEGEILIIKNTRCARSLFKNLTLGILYINLPKPSRDLLIGFCDLLTSYEWA